MKKLLAAIISMVMILTLAACAGNGGGAAKVEFDGAKYNLDLTKTTPQPMSDERATVEVLKETAGTWLGGATIHAYSDDKKTYGDFVEHIGCEPSEYQYKDSSNTRMFIWRAKDDDTAWFCAEFEENGDKWELTATGSANLGL